LKQIQMESCQPIKRLKDKIIIIIIIIIIT
jgi:hypothetical protein